MNIMWLQITSLVYLVLLIIFYFSKQRLISVENKIFKIIMVVNLFGLLIELTCFCTVSNMDKIPIINIIATRSLLIYYLIYILLFSAYVFIITYNKNKKTQEEINKYTKTVMIFCIIYFVFCSVLVCVLPMEYYNYDNKVYSYGMSVDFLFVAYGVLMFTWFISMLRNLKNLKQKKYLPLFAFLIIGTIAGIAQKLDPALLVMTGVDTLITFLLYFTIENPDLKMLTQMTLAKDAAEKANRAKSDFLSSMSHEIRTPLNAIVGFSQMIETEPSLEACREDAKDIVMASQNLLEIVNGILDISKIEANKMEIINKEYSLLPEMENISKLMIPRIGEKPIELITEFAPDIPDIMFGDISKIKQIVTNLLTNSVKYTESGKIEFKIKCVNEKDKCTLVISVADTGRGIKPEKIDTLFTKFNRLEEDKNSTIEGTGLGLAITKSLVDMMGGKIIVQSKYGEGSVFVVYVAQKIVKMDAGIELQEKLKQINCDFSGHKILVVDDNKLNLKVAEKILRGFNIDITLVESGFECIDLIKANEIYDIILMDDMMPKMKGTETLNKLKEMPNFNIPVIALTANALSGIREKYIKEGFNDYLGKPFEKEELVDILNKYLVNKDTNQDNNTIQNNVTNIENKKILIVDDNKLNIKVVSHVMKPYNFSIDEAYSGKECIEKLKSNPNQYDLIFMDYMMPEMDGIATLNNIKQIPNFKTTVIALTADSVEGARKRFLDAGFDEYIAKPLDTKILDEVVNKFFKGSSQNQLELSTNNIDTKGNVEYLKQNGIDVDRGLELLGDIDMYNETIQMFMDGVKERVDKLNTYYQNDMQNYAIEVHALKSDSKYLGFTRLAEIAYEHELKSKENNVEYVKLHYKELIDEFSKIYEILKKY